MPEVTPEQLEALATGIGELTTEVQSLNAAYHGKKAEIDASTASNEQRTTAAISEVAGSMLLPPNYLANPYFTEFEEVDGIEYPTSGLRPLENTRAVVELVSPYTKGFAALAGHSADNDYAAANPDAVVNAPELADGVNTVLSVAHPAAILRGASYPLPNGGWLNRWAGLQGTDKKMRIAKVTSPAYVDGLSTSNWVGFSSDPSWFKADKIFVRFYLYVAAGEVRVGDHAGYNLDGERSAMIFRASDFPPGTGFQLIEFETTPAEMMKKSAFSLYRSFTIGAAHESDAEYYIAMPYVAPLRGTAAIAGVGITPNNDYQ